MTELDKQADILFHCLSEHDKGIYEAYVETIPAEDWNNGEWQWKRRHGKRARRNIEHPHNLRIMYEARFADARAAKYRDFLDKHPSLRQFPR